jgi:hypothetical protein
MKTTMQPIYSTDLKSSHGCEFIGSGKESSASPFDIYHDPTTGLIFKVVSDSPVDTVTYCQAPV